MSPRLRFVNRIAPTTWFIRPMIRGLAVACLIAFGAMPLSALALEEGGGDEPFLGPAAALPLDLPDVTPDGTPGLPAGPPADTPSNEGQGSDNPAAPAAPPPDKAADDAGVEVPAPPPNSAPGAPAKGPDTAAPAGPTIGGDPGPPPVAGPNGGGDIPPPAASPTDDAGPDDPSEDAEAGETPAVLGGGPSSGGVPPVGSVREPLEGLVGPPGAGVGDAVDQTGDSPLELPVVPILDSLVIPAGDALGVVPALPATGVVGGPSTAQQPPTPPRPALGPGRAAPPARGLAQGAPEQHRPQMERDYIAVGDRALSAAADAASNAAGQSVVMGVGQTLVGVYRGSVMALIAAAIFLLGLLRSDRFDGHLREDVETTDTELEFA